MQTFKLLGGLAGLAVAGSMFVIDAYPTAVRAETQGMDRRGDRRDTRQGSREEKHECNAGSEKSRAQCRQGKRDTKQEGRHGEHPATNAPVTTTTKP